MNGAGLASLISGMQQGYSFADEMRRKKAGDERQAADDAFRTEQRGQQRKEWNKTNSYDDEVKQLTDSYYPQHQPAAAPTSPAAAGTGAPPAVDSSMEGAPAAAGASIAATAGTAAPAPPHDPMSNTNNTLDFAMKRALLDVKHGKMDGAGLLGLQKTADAMRAEKMDQAISLMNQGREDEALTAFNSTGEHSAKLVSTQDGVFEQNGVKVPTKIVTIQDGNGATRTINTAQALYQRQSMDKIIQQAQTGQQHVETARHDLATEKSTEMHYKVMQASQQAANVIAKGHLDVAKARDDREAGLLKKQSLEDQMTELEGVIGPMSPEDKKAFAKQLIGGARGGGPGKNLDEAFVNDLTKKWSENNPTAAPVDVAKFRAGLVQSFQAVSNNGQVERALRDDFAKTPPGSAGYAATHAQAKTELRMNDQQLAALGYPPPGGKVSPARAGTMVPNPLADSTVAPTWKSPTEQAQAAAQAQAKAAGYGTPQEQATAGYDAALAQTGRALAAANAAGNKAEVQRLSALFAEQSAAKNAALGGGQ